MGIGDSIGKAAENAMEDLAGTSEPADDAHAPEPGASDDDVQVHSSISEGSNAGDNSDAYRASEGGETAGTPQHAGTGPHCGRHGCFRGRGASGEPDSLEEPGASGGPGVSDAQGDTGASEALRGMSLARPGFPIRTPTSCGQTLPRGTRIPARAWAAASVTAY